MSFAKGKYIVQRGEIDRHGEAGEYGLVVTGIGGNRNAIDLVGAERQADLDGRVGAAHGGGKGVKAANESLRCQSQIRSLGFFKVRFVADFPESYFGQSSRFCSFFGITDPCCSFVRSARRNVRGDDRHGAQVSGELQKFVRAKDVGFLSIGQIPTCWPLGDPAYAVFPVIAVAERSPGEAQGGNAMWLERFDP